MQVSPKDGRCRACGGVLEITAVDDSTMEVECAECSETYLVETDAFGDGGMHYYPEFMARMMRKGQTG